MTIAVDLGRKATKQTKLLNHLEIRCTAAGARQCGVSGRNAFKNKKKSHKIC